MSRLNRMVPVVLVAAGLGCSGSQPADGGGTAPASPSAPRVASLRLHVFDCGHLTAADPGPFSLTIDEVATLEMAVPCYLIEHEDGTLLWETGLSDSLAASAGGAPVGDSMARVTVTLRAQLEALGYPPAEITYLAMSHLHPDHAGNANAFSGSVWLVQRLEHEAAFGEAPGFGFEPDLYAALETSETVILDGDHDVFGDGRVVITSAPGHTPGHQVLFVDLAETGPLVLGGDLYHFPESRLLKRVPSFNADHARSLASMDAIEDLLMDTGARIWIAHDAAADALRRKSPAFYE